MQRNPEELAEALRLRFLETGVKVTLSFKEVTMVVPASIYLQVAQVLRDDINFRFEEVIDLCGVDYLGYGGQNKLDHPRFAIVIHLLSLTHNCRLRIRVFACDDQNPHLPSLIGIWPAVNWFEREAFDLYGILFDGHPDLRRILTDYGFVGHPFRKDFPIQGYVEMRYDEHQKRIIYEPVSIVPREITPRVIRDKGENRG